MNEFEKIIAAEQQKNYQMADKDQFAFDTITQIHAQKSRLLRRTLWIVLSIALGLVIAAQLYFLQNASYGALVQTVSEFIQTHPYAIGIANIGLIASILALKRIRII